MRSHPSGHVLVVVWLLLAPVALSAQVTRWQVDGVTREGLVYGPTASPSGDGAPLVLSFHGFGDTMHNFQHTDLHRAWPEAVVVYLQGLPTRRGLPGWQVEPGDANRDLRLVDVVLTSLQETRNIDAGRVYATGFSNGGMFTYLLWAERPEVFVAYAPVAARLRPSVRPVQPAPVFHVAGEQDRVVSFSDQRAAIDVAMAVNGVASEAAACGSGCTIHGEATAAPVQTWIHGGAHVYPRETTTRIVSFFRSHRR